MTVPSGPRVVAIGGGHGLAQTLQASRRYAGELTAVVSVADDGGSSGRLRESLGIPAPGDLRRCIGALLPAPSALGAALEHRFVSGELAGHAFGNLLIAALAATTGDFVEGVRDAARLLGTDGEVLPATTGPVVLKATSASGELTGQALITTCAEIRTISLVPPDAPSPAAVVQAIGRADQIILGPGSLFTSVLAACIVPDVRSALHATSARVVYVANLREQHPETDGYDVADHVRALLAHGIVPDAVLADPNGLPLGELPADIQVVVADVRRIDLVAHDPGRLAAQLAQLATNDACGIHDR